MIEIISKRDFFAIIICFSRWNLVQFVQNVAEECKFSWNCKYYSVNLSRSLVVYVSRILPKVDFILRLFCSINMWSFNERRKGSRINTGWFSFFYFSKGSLKQAKRECDWLVMSSVFVASQSGCLFLYSREQTRLVGLSLFSTTTNVYDFFSFKSTIKYRFNKVVVWPLLDCWPILMWG